MSVASSVPAGLGQVRSWQEDFYRYLHRHPELSHQEHRTAAKVAAQLDELGYRVHRDVGGTGLVGVLQRGDGPTVLLRADMDVLPVREATGLAYASAETATDTDGDEVPVAHACGQDMHVTCLLGAAQLLAGATEGWSGTVVALFQPAEETGDGARTMVDDDLARLIPKPDVALAQHVLPGPAGQVGTRAGPTLSAADSMRVTVYGRGGHGNPDTSSTPITTSARLWPRPSWRVGCPLRGSTTWPPASSRRCARWAGSASGVGPGRSPPRSTPPSPPSSRRPRWCSCATSAMRCLWCRPRGGSW
ncbi:MAG: M20/M25/M40 family metallo-hydrolase [Pseudonocardia sp.]|nr:M20/M25/M40 family metallo-hydrolase [Pseudonocardia sp.]